jgi:T5SS/PEP-CTERM-associated repeat protein
VRNSRVFIPLNANLIRWINPQGGSYFDPNNWSPPHVPVKNEARADVAAFELAGAYTVNMAPPAAGLNAVGAGGPPIEATADRWVVVSNLFLVDGNARVSTPSLFNPSIAVSDGGQLNLLAGTIQSVHASIGHEASANPAQVLLANDGTEWLNSGRLTVGREGPGRLHILNGVVTNAEARIGGDAGAFGEVAVNGPDALWLSGNTAIGYNLGKADLIIEHSGRVTSSLAVVGFGPGQQNTVTVDGTVVGIVETPFTWTVQDKLIIGAGPGTAYLPIPSGIGSAGTVEVRAGGGAECAAHRAGLGHECPGQIDAPRPVRFGGTPAFHRERRLAHRRGRKPGRRHH